MRLQPIICCSCCDLFKLNLWPQSLRWDKSCEEKDASFCCIFLLKVHNQSVTMFHISKNFVVKIFLIVHLSTGTLVVHFKFFVMQKFVVLWMKIFHFLIVWCFFLSLCFFPNLFFLSPDMDPITPLDYNHFPPRWIKKLPVTWILLTNHMALPPVEPFLMVLSWLCVFICICFRVLVSPLPSLQPQPVSLLPGLWKANEESWAEGSFCVLVKKNNLCQRKVLQQLCCRTCSQKGWWDSVGGHKGSAGGGGVMRGHRGRPYLWNPHSFTVT